MSDSENHHHGKNEIIIVKRHGGGAHDGHHGGAWKIAYADFMTAMMAFFLVMWLVNAANEETKASVASYFNPIKLSDDTPAKKGVEKTTDQAEGDEKQERSQVQDEQETVGSAAATGEDMTATSGDETNYSEADFFKNPYSVLAEIAQEVGQQANVSVKGEGGAADSGPATGAEGGEAYRDPFDPDFWTRQVQVTRADTTSQQEHSEQDAQQQIAAVVPQQRPDQDEVRAEQTFKVVDSRIPELEAQSEEAKKADAEAEEMFPEDMPAEYDEQFTLEREHDAQELKEAIEKQIAGISGRLAEGLVVTPAEGGLLVTISDQQDAPMFNIGSAVPRREMVLAMEKIGALLDERGGSVVIRGHTDGRQFKGSENDNWRLSMARAHSAYYMLVRGGLDEDRVKQVSGFADRRLQQPDDPFADANRRIEILVEAEQG